MDAAVAIKGAAVQNADAPDIDAERRERMARNAAALEAMGVLTAATKVREAVAADRAQKAQQLRGGATAGPAKGPGVRKPRVRVPPQAPRRSHRIACKPAPAMVELDDDGNPVRCGGGGGRGGGEDEGEDGGGLLDLMACGAAAAEDDGLDEQRRIALEAQRCSFKARGVLDKNLGLSCHFCRQKTLCTEPGCPRCGARDGSAACIGKTSCAGCHSATGIFCRSCLRTRYGQDLDAVRSDPGWRCPHCYEKEHGDWREHGWFCNSSVCMRGRGMLPTGIAIHEALEKGHASVAHMLQAATREWAKKQQAKERKTEEAEEAGKEGEEGGGAAGAGAARAGPGARKRAAAAAVGDPQQATDGGGSSSGSGEGEEEEAAELLGAGGGPSVPDKEEGAGGPAAAVAAVELGSPGRAASGGGGGGGRLRRSCRVKPS
ncbi:hypothetical protein PLESTB_000310100 [Pleodorina starrii]|uniref:Zinc-finger domain-containing protein n=1 Tax=Pleodorina starrii TaxID=330485 RepID=A0A9W6EZ66_9CHLO|nr:hypothetical protein PLESTB_000310100 [Pleodorina starrii]